MTVKSPAKRSKRARKFDKKNKVPVEKPRQPLPKAVFTRMEPAAEYSNFEHDDLVEKIEFERPEGHYIRFTEPDEEELFNRVEYDMDECDEMFLEALNKRRRSKGLSNISACTFESVVDRLEKEWHSVVKDLPSNIVINGQLVSTDSEKIPCVICDESDVENSNVMVFCDGCNIAVHEDCYGIHHIPEGPWFCRKCHKSPGNVVSCIFCPNTVGAFKQVKNKPSQWAHLVCALWIPEVRIHDTVNMEKIDSFAVIDPSRRLHECYICEKNQGAPITCDNKRCITAFHPSCGRRANLYLKLVESPGGVELSAFCHKHTPNDHKHKAETLEESIATIQQETRNDVEATENETVVRAVQGHHVKDMLDTSDDILEKVDTLETLKGYYVKEKENIVNDIAHYWLQKRKDNRDVPLITRLRIEPWSRNSTKLDGDQSEKIKALAYLRWDIEKIRTLTERVVKREKLKLGCYRQQADYIEGILFPMDTILMTHLDAFMALDKDEVFIAPPNFDGGDINLYPLTLIYQKLSDHVYENIEEFIQDVESIWNCTFRKSSPKRKVAQKLKNAAPTIFTKAREQWAAMELQDGTTSLDIPIHPAIFDYDAKQPVYPQSNGEATKNTIQRISIRVMKENTRPPSPSTRTTRSKGLGDSINELTIKIPRMSQEAKELYESYIGASAITRGAPIYKVDEKRSGGVGWLYAESDDDDEDEEIDMVEVDEEVDAPAKKQKVL